MSKISPRILAAFIAVASLDNPLLNRAVADQKKLTEDQRVEIVRGLSSEYATVKVSLPRSKKPLDVETDGTYDKQKWAEASREFGPAGRKGDLVQITHVDIEKDAIILEINHGMRDAAPGKITSLSAWAEP